MNDVCLQHPSHCLGLSASSGCSQGWGQRKGRSRWGHGHKRGAILCSHPCTSEPSLDSLCSSQIVCVSYERPSLFLEVCPGSSPLPKLEGPFCWVHLPGASTLCSGTVGLRPFPWRNPVSYQILSPKRRAAFPVLSLEP